MRGTKHLTADQKEAILQAPQHEPVSAIAARLGVSVLQAGHLRKKAGIAPLMRQERSKCWQHRDQILEWVKDGLTAAEIARRVGVGRRHLRRFLDDRELQTVRWSAAGANNPAWRGGRQVDKHGYVLLHRPDHPHANRHGYVREHRLVMEKQIGRYLLPTEVVDHIDGNTGNNTPENLRLFASNKEHLQATLKGKVPRWTQEGRSRTLAGALAANHRRSTHDADPSLKTTGQTLD